MSLTMDIKTSDTWKTVEYTTAKSLMKVRLQGGNAATRAELKKILNNSDVVDSDESMEEGDSTVIFNDANNKQSDDRLPHSLPSLMPMPDLYVRRFSH